VNVQRGGPSTGLPTKTEQADLLQGLFGRNGECPMPIIAAATPSDCFGMAIEAFRIATKYMVPVMLLSDGYLANGSEPWLLPKIEELPKLEIKYRDEAKGYEPYMRDEETLARPWVKPGTPGLQHRIGGLEKQDGSGNVNYEPENHEYMVKMRESKVYRVAEDVPEPEFFGDAKGGDVLVVGWGSTYGAICGAVNAMRRKDTKVSRLHLRHIYPLSKSLDATFKKFKKILVPEMNLGQLSILLKAFVPGHDYVEAHKVTGRPFSNDEIASEIEEALQ